MMDKDNINPHWLAQVYNETKSLSKIAELTGLSECAVRARIERAGYQLIKEYRLLRPDKLKRRWKEFLEKENRHE